MQRNITAQLKKMREGDTLQVGPANVTRLRDSLISGGWRVDWIATADGEVYVAHSAFPNGLQGVMAEMEVPVSYTRPSAIDSRLSELHAAARQCYALRNEHDGAVAIDYEAIGDVFLQRSQALLAEFS